MSRFHQLTELCDAEIRRGQIQNVARRLATINARRVPREWRLPLAKISRRAGLCALGLRLLSQLVLSSSANTQKASPSELAEYAILLLRSGAVNEGLEKLEQIDSRQVPDALLFRAFGHFARWEYQAAIPHLEKYLSAPLSPYAQLVGRTNLALALVECSDHDRAVKVLEENIRLTAHEGHYQLQSTCQAFLGQVFLQEQDFAGARRELKAARCLIPQSQNHDHFLITKLNLMLIGLEERSERAFDELRKLAIQRHDWFALREADFFSLKANFSHTRYLHLLFGSPFVELRNRMYKEFDHSPKRNTYVLGPKAAPRLDISLGSIDGRVCDDVGGKSHQLLEILLRDFYQPLRIAGLFSALFPGEQFDISSSPARARQLICRARQWLKREHIPGAISENAGFYSLQVVGRNISFRVPLDRQPVDRANLQFNKLSALFRPGQDFTTREARLRLHLSTASMQRLLKWAADNGRVQMLGDSRRSTFYRLVTPR